MSVLPVEHMQRGKYPIVRKFPRTYATAWIIWRAFFPLRELHKVGDWLCEVIPSTCSMEKFRIYITGFPYSVHDSVTGRL